MFQKKHLTLFLILFALSINAQEEQKKKVSNKGKFFVYWGWNWASYTDSNIRFKGDNYDFTLQNVKAYDTPSKFTLKKFMILALSLCLTLKSDLNNNPEVYINRKTVFA